MPIIGLPKRGGELTRVRGRASGKPQCSSNCVSGLAVFAAHQVHPAHIVGNDQDQAAVVPLGSSDDRTKTKAY
ncbi:hypothetical protein [Dactylosporangium sp. CA-233914]|uniref:hypothetical protein n=1 Tax=Dactylosporangium sp. CA-233914 TaxID=3239934 RepID=UPI003D89D0F3